MINAKKPLIGIIGGEGKMGRWFKDFFISQGFQVIISDLNTEISNIELAKKADIVIISVPIKKVVDVIEEVRDFIQKDALLSDFTSLKIKSVEAMKKTKFGGVLGMHPLFGPLVQKLEGQRIVFCRVRDNHWTKFLKNVFVNNGAKILETSPKEHDLQIGIIQALLHFTNFALARTIYTQKFLPDDFFSTPVLRIQIILWGRILSLSPDLLSDIEFENQFFENILKDFQKEVKSLAEDVKEKNYDNFLKKYKETTNYLKNYIEIAQASSVEIQSLIDREPLKIKTLERKFIFKKENLKIGFLGPKGTFSQQAALNVFPDSKLLLFTEIKEVFKAVYQKEIDFGLVPAENTMAGIVSETINYLIEYPLKVTGSYDLAIHHCLLSWGKSKDDLKIIKTHYQAFSQCRNWLEKNLSKISFQSSQSTTLPILESLKSKNKDLGFIASQLAAKEYNLNVLVKNIEDSKENITKFYIISENINKEIANKLKSKKTLILFAIYDRTGVLRDILNVFAENNINLSSLHSVPSKIRTWDYFFFTEADISLSSSILKKVLQEIKKFCPIVRIIGIS